MPTNPSLSAAFIQAAHVSQGSNLPINRIVIHGTVSKTVVGGARATAGYFANPASGGSAQYVVDPATVVQCVAEAAIAWHAPPNRNSLGIELCDLVDWDQGSGRTARTYDPSMTSPAVFAARWDRPDFDAMLRLAADLTIELAAKYSVPLVKLSPADLLAGRRGICGHVDVAQAWHQTDHHDPGSTFPWGRFMDYLANPGKTLSSKPASATPPAPAPAPTPAPPKETDMPYVIVSKKGDATGAQWLSNLVTRRWLLNGDDKKSVLWQLQTKGIPVANVAAVDNLDYFGVPVGPMPPSGPNGTGPQDAAQ